MCNNCKLHVYINVSYLKKYFQSHLKPPKREQKQPFILKYLRPICFEESLWIELCESWNLALSGPASFFLYPGTVSPNNSKIL